MQRILSTRHLRQKLRAIGVLLLTEPELLSATPVSSQQKHDHHLLQQKQAFAFELNANKKMQSVLLAQPMDAKEEKDKTTLRISVRKHIRLFCLNQKLSTNALWSRFGPKIGSIQTLHQHSELSKYKL